MLLLVPLLPITPTLSSLAAQRDCIHHVYMITILASITFVSLHGDGHCCGQEACRVNKLRLGSYGGDSIVSSRENLQFRISDVILLITLFDLSFIASRSCACEALQDHDSSHNPSLRTGLCRCSMITVPAVVDLIRPPGAYQDGLKLLSSNLT